MRIVKVCLWFARGLLHEHLKHMSVVFKFLNTIVCYIFFLQNFQMCWFENKSSPSFLTILSFIVYSSALCHCTSKWSLTKPSFENKIMKSTTMASSGSYCFLSHFRRDRDVFGCPLVCSGQFFPLRSLPKPWAKSLEENGWRCSDGKIL